MKKNPHMHLSTLSPSRAYCMAIEMLDAVMLCGRLLAKWIGFDVSFGCAGVKPCRLAL